MGDNKTEQEYISYFGDCKDIMALADSIHGFIKDNQKEIIDALDENDKIESNKKPSKSNVVLATLHDDLRHIGFIVEDEKQKIELFFNSASKEDSKVYSPDGIHKDPNIVLEVEAGMAMSNYHVLKDYIECLSVDTLKLNGNIDPFCPNYLILIVPVNYTYGSEVKHKQIVYDKVKLLFTPLFKKRNNKLKGLCLIGYLMPDN